MEWVVTLSGNAHVLEELSKVFNTPDTCIQRDNEHFVLKSRDWVDFTSCEQVRDHTNEILASLNGAAKLSLGSHSSITIGSISKIHNDGSRHTYVSVKFVAAPATITISARITRADGTIEEFHPADPVVTWMDLSQRDANVKRALYLIENDFETWYGLYKVYEVIREDVGDIPGKGWCAQAELKRFTQTANSPEAIGVGARHGKKIPAPPDPMSLSSAKAFIKNLIYEWFKEKQIQYNI